MKVKVHCPCSSKFEFEVEPAQGRMPVSINCPTCGQDATALANAVIASQLLAESPAPPMAGGLRIITHKEAPAPQANEAAPDSAPAEMQALTFCVKHKTEAAIESCHVCGKAMCGLCMQQFGYVCSVYCRQQAESRGIFIPKFEGQESVRASRAAGKAKLITTAVCFALVGVFALWIWYSYFAREPKVVYSIALPKNQNWDKNTPYIEPGEYHLIAPGQLLSISNEQVRLTDVKLNQQLWSASIPTNGDFEDRAYLDFEDYTPGRGRDVFATSNDLWIVNSGQLLRLDRATGASKELPVKDKILKIVPGDDVLTLVTGKPEGEQKLNRITLSTLNIQSEVLVAAKTSETAVATNAKPGTRPPALGNTKPSARLLLATKNATPAAATNKASFRKVAKLATPESTTPDLTDDNMDSIFESRNIPLMDAGANMVQFTTKLLEKKIVEHTAMKQPKKGKSVLDNANLSASQGLEVAEEMMNDSQREMTGGVEREDASTYEVSIHRFFGGSVPDWSGQVAGSPHLTPLKTVDILTAGQGVYAFDKQNKKIWEGKLAFPMSGEYESRHPAMTETKDAVYVADKGAVTCFDLTTGTVRWRFNTVGTTQILFDENLGLYVNSTTADPSSVQFSQQANLRNKVYSLTTRLDPKSGKALWQEQSLADELMVSGKFLYAQRVNQVAVLLRLEDGPESHYYLTLVEPGSGKPIWVYHRSQESGVLLNVQKTWVMLKLKQKLLVLKFFSL